MNYRDDIDGLRAIAVIGVIFYHFGIGNLTGGYVGVDVFFVLSGYLIGGITFRQLDKSQFSFTTFYFRRIRRLFPVYVFVMLATFLVAYFIMLLIDFREFGQSIFASTIYASNILFYLEAGYFDSASHLKPLLHTWSLSIEEQFYLIFPFLAWLTRNYSSRWVFSFFVFLTIASFLSAVLYIDKDNTAVFYLYPFRAWELFLGVILAIKVVPEVRNKLAASLLANAGLVMILVPYFLYDSTTKFPGYSAVLPCIGTALVLHTGSRDYFAIHKLLATSVLKFIGKISYSLYLWHWPIFVFYVYDKENELSMMSSLLLLLLTFTLSVFSWVAIEKPFRKGNVILSKTKLSVFSSTAIVSCLFLAIGFNIHVTNGMPSRLNQEQSLFSNINIFGPIPNCDEHENEIFPGIRHCRIGDPQNSEQYTLVWGDSHGGAFAQGIIKAFKENNNDVLFAWSGGCPTLFDITKEEKASTNAQDLLCTSHNDSIKTLINEDADKIQAVILIGRWSYYINGTGYGVDSHNTISVKSSKVHEEGRLSERDSFTNMFESTLLEIHQSGAKVFVLEQVPEFNAFDSRKHAIQLLNGRSGLEEVIEKYTFEQYSDVMSRQAPIMELLEVTDRQGISTTLHTHRYFCNEERCSVLPDGVPMYFDNNHISTYGAEELSEVFNPVIKYINLDRVK